jgi:hypothetical protein
MTAPSDGMVTPATRPSRPEKRDDKKIREQVEIIVIYDIFSKSIAESPSRAEKIERSLGEDGPVEAVGAEDDQKLGWNSPAYT